MFVAWFNPGSPIVTRQKAAINSAFRTLDRVVRSPVRRNARALDVVASRRQRGPGARRAAALGLGFACGVLRARSGSLWPAIACHVVGNVAGIPGGILGVILYRLTYGRLPEILT